MKCADKNLQPRFGGNLEDFVVVVVRIGVGGRVGVEAQKPVADARDLTKILNLRSDKNFKFETKILNLRQRF